MKIIKKKEKEGKKGEGKQKTKILKKKEKRKESKKERKKKKVCFDRLCMLVTLPQSIVHNQLCIIWGWFESRTPLTMVRVATFPLCIKVTPILLRQINSADRTSSSKTVPEQPLSKRTLL